MAINSTLSSYQSLVTANHSRGSILNRWDVKNACFLVHVSVIARIDFVPWWLLLQIGNIQSCHWFTRLFFFFSFLLVISAFLLFFFLILHRMISWYLKYFIKMFLIIWFDIEITFGFRIFESILTITNFNDFICYEIETRNYLLIFYFFIFNHIHFFLFTAL